MKKSLFAIFSVILFVFINSPSSALAGGFNVELTPKNNGTANSEGVNVEIYTGTADRTVFNVGYEFRLTFLNPNSGQKCIMTKPTSDTKGLAYGTCYSETPGVFEIYPEVHNYSKETGEWWNLSGSVRTAVRFESSNPMQTSQPKPTFQPKNTSPETTSTPDNSPQLEEKVEELEKRVEKQEEDISILQQIVNKLISIFSSLRKF
jgi:hypothetical protein